MAAIHSVSAVTATVAAQTSQPTVPQQPMADARSRLLCRFHMKGSCRDGQWCPFSHDRQLSVPIPDHVCWFYLQSQCMYGDNCRFVHSDASSILTNHRLSAPVTQSDGMEWEESAPTITETNDSLERSPSTIPQQMPELSRHQSLPTLLAHNSYNISSEVTQKCKHNNNEYNNRQQLPQLVPFQSVISCSQPQQPNQSSNPSLINDSSRQSSEDTDSGYSGDATHAKHPTPSSATVSTGGGGGKTYAQMASNRDYSHEIVNQLKALPLCDTTSASTTGPAIVRTPTLCPYAIQSIDGMCPYPEDQCSYTHGMVCDLCGRSCLHPEDVVQQNKHRDECIKEHEREMEISFAVQRSLDKACGICMDIVIEKEPITERRFGILEKCSHIFCLSCIRKWRQTKQFDNRTIRGCPECRVSSDFVIPSKYWYDDSSEKQQLIDSYKSALSTKPCKYFKQGQGECPFAGACFYLHAYPDGRKAEMPPPRQRRRQNHEGELETLRDMLLWNYLEVRDDNHWLLALDLEDVFDIQEMGLLSGYETDDDESDLSDYAEGLIG